MSQPHISPQHPVHKVSVSVPAVCAHLGPGLDVLGLALVGVVAFSVLAALEPDVDAYVIGQIASALVVLVTVFLLRRLRPHAP